MSVQNSALNQIWSSILHSFSLALSLYFSKDMGSMHLNINLGYVLYYCPTMLRSVIVLFFFFFCCTKRSHVALVLISERLWLYPTGKQWGDIDWSYLHNDIRQLTQPCRILIWCSFLLHNSVMKCENSLCERDTVSIKVALWTHLMTVTVWFTANNNWCFCFHDCTLRCLCICHLECWLCMQQVHHSGR